MIAWNEGRQSEPRPVTVPDGGVDRETSPSDDGCAVVAARSRIFLASALLAVLSTAAWRCSSSTAGSPNEGETVAAARDPRQRRVVDQLRTTRTETYTITARLIADSPTLKAAVDHRRSADGPGRSRASYQAAAQVATCCS